LADLSISPANLRTIENALAQLSRASADTSQKVTQVQVQQVQLDDKVEQLARDLTAFIAADRRSKQLQLAETRVVKVRQELESTYGHYGEVRRRATGILQALDVHLVTDETVQSTTEEVMVGTPRYWLAPALVALAAWSRDDEELAKRALTEALKRDSDKTALFFALVLRRLGRREATARWLGHFFARQDPRELRREFVVLLDAVSLGAFGPESQAIVGDEVGAWLEALGQEAGFLATQQQRWQAKLAALTRPVAGDTYASLARFSPAWPQLQASLSAVLRNGFVIEHFRAIVDGELQVPRHVETQIDTLLDGLVSDFDTEELPLRTEEARLQAIIDHDGDLDQATATFQDRQQALLELIDFPTLLANAAMNPEESGASRGTQRLAVALSRDWIVAAHDGLTAATRSAAPAEIPLYIEEWQASVGAETEDDALAGGLARHMDGRRDAAVAAIKFNGLPLACAIGGGVLALLGLVTLTIVIIAIALLPAIYAGWSYFQLEPRRAAARQAGDEAKQRALADLQGCISEVVEYRREWEAEDKRAEEARALLLSVSPATSILNREDDARAVIA
jgi:hypothetical protein